MTKLEKFRKCFEEILCERLTDDLSNNIFSTEDVMDLCLNVMEDSLLQNKDLFQKEHKQQKNNHEINMFTSNKELRENMLRMQMNMSDYQREQMFAEEQRAAIHRGSLNSGLLGSLLGSAF